MGRASRRKRQGQRTNGDLVGATLSGPAGGRRRAGAPPERAAGAGGGVASTEAPGGVLEVLHAAQLEREQADQRLRGAVVVARTAGCSWHDIGLALGMTAEGARQRYQVRAPAAPAAEK